MDMAQLEWLSGLFDDASIPHEPAFPSSRAPGGDGGRRAAVPQLQHGSFNNAVLLLLGVQVAQELVVGLYSTPVRPLRCVD